MHFGLFILYVCTLFTVSRHVLCMAWRKMHFENIMPHLSLSQVKSLYLAHAFRLVPAVGPFFFFLIHLLSPRIPLLICEGVQATGC